MPQPPGAREPKFSVLIATWNRAPLLPRALDALLAQSFTDWEAILVDDGSTDDTAAVVDRYRADPRILYLPRPHAGLSVARNAGAAIARGAWITFLDSDDAYAPDHLEVRAGLCRDHPDAALIHGGYRVIGPPEAHFVPDARDSSRMIPLAECVVGGTFVIRRKVFAAAGGFPDIPYAMDLALFERLEGTGPVIVCLDPTYLYHREAGDGMCAEAKPDPRSDPSGGPQTGT